MRWLLRRIVCCHKRSIELLRLRCGFLSNTVGRFGVPRLSRRNVPEFYGRSRIVELLQLRGRLVLGSWSKFLWTLFTWFVYGFDRDDVLH